MRKPNSGNWMLSDAVEMLAKADRLQREAFRLMHSRASRPCWEPPVDVLETEHEVIVFTALPGVDTAEVSTTIEDGVLVISGERVLPPELQTATIHRLELPQGSFLRRVALPPGQYDGVRRSSWNGCLVVTLHKMGL
jgi:HSP20 family protein